MPKTTMYMLPKETQADLLHNCHLETLVAAGGLCWTLPSDISHPEVSRKNSNIVFTWKGAKIRVTIEIYVIRCYTHLKISYQRKG